MQFLRPISLPVFLLLLAGCLASTLSQDVLRAQVQVFGIELRSAVDHRVINGVVGTEEPCLHGYEWSFDPLQITVGYSFARRVRKITTRNPSTSIFAVHPGMPFGVARPLLATAGFVPTTYSPNIFQLEDCLLTLQVDSDGNIVALTLEIAP